MPAPSRRHDFVIHPIRGNIDTRIRKIQAGEFGATILALAGVKRAGLFDHSIMHPISADVMLPAPGQGALALQCRRGDQKTLEILSLLDDRITRRPSKPNGPSVAALNCDCHSPIAVLAERIAENQTLPSANRSPSRRRLALLPTRDSARSSCQFHCPQLTKTADAVADIVNQTLTSLTFPAAAQHPKKSRMSISPDVSIVKSIAPHRLVR